jgi:4-hydroxy-2-oxoglutarate aldolase
VLFPNMMAGARGGIVALACAAPRAMRMLYLAWSKSDFRAAAAIQRVIAPSAAAVTAKYGIAGLKAAMALEGLDSGAPRRPLLPLKQSQIEDLQQTLRKMNSELAELS